MSDLPLVSIIIPTRNSVNYLSKCLQSLKDQTYKNLEVIIVDKYSKDGVADITRSHGYKLISGPQNKPAARNIGAKCSRGEFIYFADSDYIFESTLIEEIVNIFMNKTCDAVIVPEIYAGRGYLIECRNLEKRIYNGVDIIEAPRVYKRWVVDKVLFDEKNEGPDEYDFYFTSLKLGINTRRTTSRVFLQEDPLQLRKKYRHGKFFIYYQKKHEGEKTIQKQVDVSFRLNLLYKAFRVSFAKASGLLIIKWMEFLAFSTGRFIGRFDRKIQRLMVSAKEEFDSVGADYEKSMYKGSIGNKFVDRIEKEKVLEILKSLFNDRNIKALDVGAGNGRWSREFLRLNYNVTALDISENMCKYLRNNYSGLKVICSGIEYADMNEKFDLVFSFRNFKYVTNLEQALKNIKDFLKNEGHLIIEMPNMNNPFYGWLNAITPILYSLTKGRVGKYFILANMISEKEFRKILERNGLKVIRKENLLFFPHKVYSMINHEYAMRFVGILDRKLSKFIPRSHIFVLRKVDDIGRNTSCICHNVNITSEV